MIRSFKDKRTEHAFHGERPKGFSKDLFKTARRKLRMVHAAHELKDLMSPPGNRLHRLYDDREGQYAIRINDQFRVCFVWREGDAYEVEVTDYH